MSNIEKIKKEYIQCVKECGQAIIDNAEKIVNDYGYETELNITCIIQQDGILVPQIIVEQVFIPKKYVLRYSGK